MAKKLNAIDTVKLADWLRGNRDVIENGRIDWNEATRVAGGELEIDGLTVNNVKGLGAALGIVVSGSGAGKIETGKFVARLEYVERCLVKLLEEWESLDKETRIEMSSNLKRSLK